MAKAEILIMKIPTKEIVVFTHHMIGFTWPKVIFLIAGEKTALIIVRPGFCHSAMFQVLIARGEKL